MKITAKQIHTGDTADSVCRGDDPRLSSTSITTVALVANFTLTDGELIVSHLSSMTPSIVDGEFIVMLETI